jgi:predicted nuclease of predicted toxin-antitoxin system
LPPLPPKKTCPFRASRTFDEIKIDENLPLRLGALLKNLGHDVHTLHDELLLGRSDKDIWEATQKESRFLITQDLDFSDLRQFAPGSHHGILLIRLQSPNRENLIERIGELFQDENVGEWSGSFVVATERKIRVIKSRT